MGAARNTFGAEFEARLATAVALAGRSVALVREIAPGAGDVAPLTEAADACEAASRLARDGVFDVAVVGEMKAGKSTLFNAMLLGEELLPAQVTPCTAKLIVIAWAERWSGKARFVGRDQWDDWLSGRTRARTRSSATSPTRSTGSGAISATRRSGGCSVRSGRSTDRSSGSTRRPPGGIRRSSAMSRSSCRTRSAQGCGSWTRRACSIPTGLATS